MTPAASETLVAAFGPTAAVHAWQQAWQSTVVDDTEIDPSTFSLLGIVQARHGGTAAAEGRSQGVLQGIGRRCWATAHIHVRTLAMILQALDRLDRPVLVLPGSMTTAATLGDPTGWTNGPLELLVDPSHVPVIAATLLTLGATGEQPVGSIIDTPQWAPFVWVQLRGVHVIVRWPGAVASKEGPDPASSLLDLDAELRHAEEQRVGAVVFRTLAVASRVTFCLRRAASATDPQQRTRALADLCAALDGPDGGVLTAADLRAVASEGAELMGLLAPLGALTDVERLVGLLDEARAVVASDAAREAARAAAQDAARVRAAAARPVRIAPLRQVRNVGAAYRRATAARREPVTARGFVRWLAVRWGVSSRRELPGAAARRIGRALRRGGAATTAATRTAPAVRTEGER